MTLKDIKETSSVVLYAKIIDFYNEYRRELNSLEQYVEEYNKENRQFFVWRRNPDRIPKPIINLVKYRLVNISVGNMGNLTLIHDSEIINRVKGSIERINRELYYKGINNVTRSLLIDTMIECGIECDCVGYADDEVIKQLLDKISKSW